MLGGDPPAEGPGKEATQRQGRKIPNRGNPKKKKKGNNFAFLGLVCLRKESTGAVLPPHSQV
eukprot:8248512-Pyramimonas_sp.AAC.1